MYNIIVYVYITGICMRKFEERERERARNKGEKYCLLNISLHLYVE